MATTISKPIVPSIAKKPFRKVRLISNPGTDAEETYIALLNPTKLKETIQVEWSRLPVVGLDYEVPQYNRTRSIVLPLTFYFSAFEQARQINPQFPQASLSSLSAAFPSSKIQGLSMDFANFLRSLCFPTKSELRPPTVKVIWPNVLTFLAVVESVTFDYAKFDSSLAPIAYSADVNFLEVRFTRRFSEVVRASGLLGDSDDSTNQ